MAGVIEADGTQWEHCNECGAFVKIQDLGYLKHSVRWPGDSSDICLKCTDKYLRAKIVKFEDIKPSRNWRAVSE